jgi:hypothetical protein
MALIMLCVFRICKALYNIVKKSGTLVRASKETLSLELEMRMKARVLVLNPS